MEVALSRLSAELGFKESDAQGLSNVAWALARLGVLPRKRWIKKFREVSGVCELCRCVQT